jgi:hypothetical protein
MTTKAARPSFVEDEHLTYLDAVRESGATNMFGAAPYLVAEFGLDKRESREILSYWMKTFGERTNREGRHQ